MRGVLRVLNRTGDTVLEWDTEDATKLDPGFVRSEFDRLVSQGHMAFQDTSSGGQSTAEQIKSFDPAVHDRVVMSPQFVGG